MNNQVVFKNSPIDNHCCFNKVVDCSENNCRLCGWNPAVAADRIEDWQMKRDREK